MRRLAPFLLALCASHSARGELPPSLASAARGACGGLAPSSTAGPWARGTQRYWASVHWREGASSACLALLEERGAGAQLVARGSVAAGYSERYQEAYAPELRSEPVWLAGQLPMPLTAASQMGPGGGGGTLVTLWRAERRAWAQAFSWTDAGATNINTAVESPCDPGELALRGATLEFESCFDGVRERRRAEWNGRRFLELGAR